MKAQPNEAANRPSLIMGKPEKTIIMFTALFVVIASAVLIRHVHWTDIHAAIEAGDVERVRAMLAKRPGLLRVRKGNIYAPLHRAAITGRGEIVELLIAKGASVAEADYAGNTALHLATSHDRIDIVRILLAAKADTAAKNWQGDCPVHLAADAGRVDIVRLFIDAGADLNVKDSLNRTPLKRAADRGRNKVVDLLREHGAKE